jgi:hypothetical protein
LRALDSKCRNEQRTAGGMGIAHFGGKMLASRGMRNRRAVPVAIGRLGNNVIQPRRRLRIGLEQFRIGTDIARGQHPQRMAGCTLTGEFDLDRSRAKQMPRVPVPRAYARHDLDPALILDRVESIQRGNGIGLRINWIDFNTPAGGIAPVQRRDFRLLDAARVGQHVRAQIDSAARGHDASAESFARQLRQQPAMVDMCVGQQDGRDIGRPERKGTVVQRL